MQIDLTGKKALVGGATSGIGKAIAMELAACGAEVTLMSRNEDKLKDVLKELSAVNGQKHGYLQTDFMDFEQHQANLTAYFNSHQVDILINNTNGPAAGDVSHKNIGDYQQAFDLLFKNAVYTSELALKGMRS